MNRPINTMQRGCGINVMQFGYENCEKSHFFGPAIRTYWLIHYVVSGCGIFRKENAEYKISAGEMFVISPYEVTYYEADKFAPWSYIWIGFTTEDELPVKLSDVIKCPEAMRIFTEMKKSDDMSNGKNAYLTARLWDLFSMLMEGENNKTDYVFNALSYIHSEYMEELTVEKIAKRLNVDRTYLSALFKKRTGVSPKQYILSYRMKEAASLLSENEKSVSIAARSVGYNDIYNFSKMFKKYFGVSPRSYKKNIKEQSVL